MPDKEKVIKALEIHISTDDSVGCDSCAYENDERCIERVMTDALAMLKEHEPVEPTINEYGEIFCGNCGENVGIIGQTIKTVVRMRYCPECGRRVKYGKIGTA